MKNYVLGIDIGGTKSHLAIFGKDGKEVRLGEWGPLNHEVLPGSFKQFHSELQTFIHDNLKKRSITIDQIAYATLGVAGIDTKAQHDQIEKIIKEIGLSDFTLCNDAYLGIMAGNPEGVGICAINGTGSAIVGRNEEGRMFQLRGAGYVSNDRGGGGYLGERAIGHVYEALFCQAEDTQLVEELFELFGISSKYEYVDKITEELQKGTKVRALAGLKVFEAAEKGDMVARGMLHEMAVYYADTICGVINELKFKEKDIDIVLAGSVFVKGNNRVLLETLKTKVSSVVYYKELHYHLLEEPPVMGAVKWALKKAG